MSDRCTQQTEGKELAAPLNVSSCDQPGNVKAGEQQEAQRGYKQRSE
jgi:hypothetical protein